MPLNLKTQPQIAAALARRRAWLAKRGRKFRLRPPSILHPVRFEREYYRALHKRFTKLYELVAERLTARVPQLMAQAAAELGPQRFDAFPDDLDTVINGISVEFGRDLTDSEIQSISKQYGVSVSEWNAIQNNKVFKTVLGVDIFRQEPYLNAILETYASDNAALITSLSDRHISRVRAIAMQGARQGLPASEVEKMIRAAVGKTEANLRLIARDQVSKLNGQLTRVRQTALGVEKYIWRTSLDERVRASHRAKEDKEYSWDKPPADTGHPGQDYQCRCYAEPVLEDLIGPGEGLSGGATLEV